MDMKRWEKKIMYLHRLTKKKDMEELVQICDHIIFNSFAQYEKYKEMCRESAKVRKDKKQSVSASASIRSVPRRKGMRSMILVAMLPDLV